MAFTSLRWFRLSITHQRGRVIRKPGDSGLKPSEKEAWAVRVPTEKHVALFRKAVTENWDTDEVVSALRSVVSVRVKPPGRMCRSDADECKAEAPDLIDAAGKGSPRDVADLIWDMIEHADPTVREMIRERLGIVLSRG